MANIREIAQKANVSIATVSRYINQSGYVGKDTANKIKKVIDEIGYTPNELAKAVFSKTSKTIALMVPNLVNPFFAEMAFRIETKMAEKGFTTLLFSTEDNLKKERAYLELVESYRVAGIITSRTQCFDEYNNIKIPVVSFESSISENIVTVTSNNYLGGKMALDHLYEVGCRNILHIKGPEIFEATEERCKGFVEAAEEKGVDYKVIEFDSDFNIKLTDQNIEKLKNINFYDGIFVFNDIVAAMITKFIGEKGLNVPNDIQIVGFDNSFICNLIEPSLTTIHQSIDLLSATVVNQLIMQLEGKSISRDNIYIDVELIKRKSTR